MVYIVIRQCLYNDYDPEILGVYSNEDAAQAHFKALVSEYGKENYADVFCYNDGETKLEIHRCLLEDIYE